MNKKQSEVSLGTMMRGNGYFVHKWRDRGFVSCPSCHKVVTTCPYCKGSMLLPKAQTYPDFLVAMQYAYIECKQGEESWGLGDISPVQETLLNGYANDSWIFLEMGTGKAPKGKKAFLIPWTQFKGAREAMFSVSQKSVRFEKSAQSKMPTADEIFGKYQLVWMTRFGWQIPIEHLWWTTHTKNPISDKIVEELPEPKPISDMIPNL